ncbi:MAG: hypothetical protein CBD27_02770 [Rhodospirillaceae bacterium TMED167]|nr:NIPSNAP family protein [Rhodospirillaceae bacterium]OUW29620.1 MAG: hypothetical protein CBD27_02770 [Rhodospirillaceae bacterium TMED167]
MLTELRIYTTYPGKAMAFAKLYKEEGLPHQLPVGGKLAGFYRAEFGNPNEVVLIWEYESYDDRLRRREDLFKVPEFLAFIEKSAPLLKSEEGRILVSMQ